MANVLLSNSAQLTRGVFCFIGSLLAAAWGATLVSSAPAWGSWEAAYDSPSRAAVPEDLAAALAANPAAARFFATLDATNRYAVLFRIHNVKKAETRGRKIAQFVEMLAQREKLHP